jgi:uncharacterized membrane protein
VIQRARLDALTDGVFAFAMTLLVLDLRLPDGFAPHSSREFLSGLYELEGQYIAYVISFFVLGARWLTQVSHRGVPERTTGKYGIWVLIYLFLITSIPFSTMVVGRYNDFAPATWLYALNLILSAGASLRMTFLAEEGADKPAERGDHFGSIMLIVSALVSVGLSFWTPEYATLAYLLNLAPPLRRHIAGRADPQ